MILLTNGVGNLRVLYPFRINPYLAGNAMQKCMLKKFIGGACQGLKMPRGGGIFVHRSRYRGISKPRKYFIQHTFLRLLPGKLGFALCWGGRVYFMLFFLRYVKSNASRWQNGITHRGISGIQRTLPHTRQTRICR